MTTPIPDEPIFEPQAALPRDPKVLSGRILIVEDLELMRRIIRQTLEEGGFRNLSFAEDGVQALEMVRADPPDLIILDVKMPRMDGFEVCQRLRADEISCDLPIIIQSSYKDPDEKNRAFSVGATDYVCKPINPPELIARTYLLLEKALMIRKLNRYRRRVERELAIAKSMQQRLFPSPERCKELSEMFHIDIESYFLTSSELGGDLFGLRPIDRYRLGFYILDVSGHGVGAAIETFKVHQLIEQIWTESILPSDVLRILNSKVSRSFEVGQFLTMLCGVIDLRENKMTYASAAQPPPVLLSPTESRVELAESAGFLLGVDGSATFEDREIAFKPGDSFVSYSDALIETRNSSGHRCGEFGLRDRLEAWVKDKDTTSYFDRLVTMFEDEYLSNMNDDLTILMFTRLE